MPSKNDLSAYQLKPTKILSDTKKVPKTAGRKPLPAHEKRSETLVIKLTPCKRGLADRAVYVRHVLSQTNLFKKQ